MVEHNWAGDRNDDLLTAQGSGDFIRKRLEFQRLYTDEDNIASVCDLSVAGDRDARMALLKLHKPVRAAVAGQHITRLKRTRRQKGIDEQTTHAACSDKSHLHLGYPPFWYGSSLAGILFVQCMR
ncbi:hypothetical protein D3C75_925980 [compost metagenome]